MASTHQFGPGDRPDQFAKQELPCWCNTVVNDALSERTHLNERIGQYDKHLARIAKEDAHSSIPGN